MATAASIATNVANDDQPQTAGEIIVLDPRDVIVGERLRPIDTVWAGALGQSMRRDGQIHAIEVCQIDRRWHLAGPGGHRLTGAIAAGIPIEARVVSDDANSARRREAAENVFRRANSPYERAAAVAELVRLHKLRVGIDPAKSGRAISIDMRWQKAAKIEAEDTNATVAFVYGWSDAVAAQIGFKKRAVEYDLRIYRRVAPSVIEMLRTAAHPALTVQKELLSLAKLEVPDQTRVVTALIDGADGVTFKSVGQVVAAIGVAGKPPRKPLAPDSKRQAAILGALKRMSATERAGFFQLASFHDLMPAEARRLLAPLRRDPRMERNDG